MVLCSAALTVLVGAAYAFDQVVLDTNKHVASPWTQFKSPVKRVAVIGAGPAGLQAAAALKQHNFTVRLFDRAPGPGGNWLYSEEIPVREPYPDEPPGKEKWLPEDLPATQYYSEGDDGLSLDERWREHWLPRAVWASLHTNSPAVITSIPDVPYPDDHSWVISHFEIQRHVRAYASLHELNTNDSPSITSYSTRVEKLTKASDGVAWNLTLRRADKLHEPERLKSTWWTEQVDAVVVASGPYDTPHVPDIDGLLEWSKAKNKDDSYWSVYHSRVYRTPQRYTGKTVLVVGVGTSGSEIARDLAPYAKKVYASSKKYDWEKLGPFQRRAFCRFPDGTEFIPQISSFGPLSSYKEGISAGVINLVNGTVLKGIDEVILATGYTRSNPFLHAVLNGTLGNDLSSDESGDPPKKPPKDVFNGNPLRNVHWTGHYIPDPTLAFTNVRPWTVGKYQSYALAKVWEGTARIPNEAELWRQYNSSRYNNFSGQFGTSAEAIVRQYVAWLNNESLEHGGRLVAPWPVQNWEIFSYYANQEWEKDYIFKSNFTRFEQLPAKDWSKEALWDAAVFEDVSW